MRRVHRKRPLDYLLPFLLIVGVGVIGVLGFQVWFNMQAHTGDVYFYEVIGKAKILQYGTTEWQPAYSGTKLLLGDSIKTLQGSRLVVQFFNGTVVRLNEDTELSLVELSKRSDREKIALRVDHGSVWVNKMQSENVIESPFEIRTPKMMVHDVGTIFELESGNEEVVRVMRGSVKVTPMPEGKDLSLEPINVGVGQEIHLDQAVLMAFQKHENPSVLMALNDEFKASDWSIWNSQEDQTPTDFASQKNKPVTAVADTTTQTAPTTATDASTPASPVGTEIQVGAPTLTLQQPANDHVTVQDGKVAISGTVSAGTVKIVVKQNVGGVTEEYKLQKFKEGDTTFSYNLSETYNNIKPGENIYNFYAEDKDGKRNTEGGLLRVTYEKTDAVAADSSTTPATTEPLVAPTVVSFNGVPAVNAATDVKVSIVKVIGSVRGAAKMVVNGLTLTKFKPGDTSWTYFANVEGGNLKEGLNEYEAYAIDANGKESEHFKFTITYTKP